MKSRPARLLGVRVWWLPVYLALGALLTLYFAWDPPFPGSTAGTVAVEEHAGQRWITIYRPAPNRDWIYALPAGEKFRTSEEARETFARLERPYLKDLPIPDWAPKPWIDLEPVTSGTNLKLSESRDRAGWPMRCVTSNTVRDFTQTPVHETTTGAVDVGRGILMPIHPIPLGAAIDLLLFATLVAAAHELLAWPWRAWNRHFARVNNICENCKYNRSGLPQNAPCPECGLLPSADPLTPTSPASSQSSPPR